jgi:hypothetical protein
VLLIGGIVAGLAAAGGAAWWFLGRKPQPYAVTSSADTPEAEWNAKTKKVYEQLLQEEKDKGWPALETELIGSTTYRLTGGVAGKDKPPRFPFDVVTKMNDVSKKSAGISAMGLEEMCRREGYSPEFAAGMKFLADHVGANDGKGKIEVLRREDANSRVSGGKWEYVLFNQIRPKLVAEAMKMAAAKKGKK